MSAGFRYKRKELEGHLCFLLKGPGSLASIAEPITNKKKELNIWPQDFTLLDDIAALMDDVAVMSKVATKQPES
jgi:hypothetical protein